MPAVPQPIVQQAPGRLPVALGIGAGFIGSCWSTVVGGAQVYFDSVTMFVFFSTTFTFSFIFIFFNYHT